MPVQFVPFTRFAPEQEFGGDLLRCENVIPALGGYRSLSKPTQDGTTLGVKLNSCFVHRYPSGVGTGTYVGDAATEFFGAQQKLYAYNYGTGVFDDLTGALVLTANAGAWRFASYGNDVIAVNGIDAPARRVANAGNFVALGASTFIPKGRFVGVVREYMIHAALSNVGRFQDEFAWSDANDATWYDDKTAAARPASLAGSKRIVSSAGQLMGFAGGEYGIFWKRNSMHGLQFTGGNDIWRLDEISSTVGTPFPNSIVLCKDGFRRFWGGDGFYEQSGLSAPQRIPNSEGVASWLIDRGFYVDDVSLPAKASYAGLEEEDLAMFGVEDPELNGVFWFYQTEDVTAAQGCQSWLYYSYKDGLWSTGSNQTPPSVICAATVNNYLASATLPPRFIVGATFEPTTSSHTTFQGPTQFPYTIATQRFMIAQEGAPSQGKRVRVTAIQPVVVPRQGTYTTYALEAVPANLAFRLLAANDIHFQAQTDADGGAVSPREASVTMADANSYGWIGVGGLEGRSFLLEMIGPESDTPMRGLRGFWVDYAEVA